MPTHQTRFFEIERVGVAIVIIPQFNLSEIAFEQHEAEASRLLELLDSLPGKNVVVDCCLTDCFGSSALGFFAKLLVWVRLHSGRIVFCNLSDHEREILHVTKMDRLWSICTSRTEALESLQESVINGSHAGHLSHLHAPLRSKL